MPICKNCEKEFGTPDNLGWYRMSDPIQHDKWMNMDGPYCYPCIKMGDFRSSKPKVKNNERIKK